LKPYFNGFLAAVERHQQGRRATYHVLGIKCNVAIKPHSSLISLFLTLLTYHRILSFFLHFIPFHSKKPTTAFLKMVRYASSTAPNGPIPASAIPLRRASAVALIVLLYTSAQPFTPFYWLLSLEGSLLFDRFFSGALLLAGLYFQWQIASRTHPVACIIPRSKLGMSDTSIRGGNVGAKSSDDFVYVYQPSEYWVYAGAEAALLCVAEWGGYEMVRRGILIGVLTALWSVGWFVTPEWIKRQAWSTLKQIWFWLAVDELLRYGHRGGGRRGRRW
jgi:hypothetical protein